MKPNGAILYKGRSMIDGKPIVAIATGLRASSANEKTGNMVQVWILADDVSPVDAVKTGADASICGDCKHRGTMVDGKVQGRTCYVTVFQGPRSVWSAYKRGVYMDANEAEARESIGAGRMVRLGAYGDPAAVPMRVWDSLLRRAAGWTGYTHQWRNDAMRGRHLDGLRRYCMASVDNPAELDAARADGWRTFRVRTADQALAARESICPASQEAGYKTNCATCRACHGTANSVKGSIAIIVHGAMARKFAA